MLKSFLIVLLVATGTFSQVPPCPKYPLCQVRQPAECSGESSEDCPGGQPACFRDAVTSEITSCCCIVHNPKYKHLREDAEKPALSTKGLRTYYMRFCPFSQRVMLTTKVKNLTVDDVYVNLKYKPDWFVTELGGKVPVTELPGGILNDDFIEVDFLDEEYPMPRKLHPTDPLQKSIDRQLAIKYQSFIPSKLFDILYGTGLTNSSQVPRLLTEFEGFLTDYGNELERRGTRFFAGDEYPGFLDYIMWPWIERRAVFPVFYPTQFDYDSRSPQLAQWIELMKEDEAVKEFMFSPEVHYEFSVSTRAGEPNYDMIAGF